MEHATDFFADRDAPEYRENPGNVDRENPDG